MWYKGVEERYHTTAELRDMYISSWLQQPFCGMYKQTQTRCADHADSTAVVTSTMLAVCADEN